MEVEKPIQIHELELNFLDPTFYFGWMIQRSHTACYFLGSLGGEFVRLICWINWWLTAQAIRRLENDGNCFHFDEMSVYLVKYLENLQ